MLSSTVLRISSRALRKVTVRLPLTTSCAPLSTVADTNEPDRHLKPKVFFTFEKVEENIFRSAHLTTSAQTGAHAAYGGLIMSQALAAAEKSLGPEFTPHSLHSYFILNVDTTIPVDYVVRRLRDGRSYCTRAVEAVQNGKVCFSLQASFHVKEPDSLVHQSVYPSVVKPADECQELNAASGILLAQIHDGVLKGSEHTRCSLAKMAKSDRTKWLFDLRCTDTATLFGLGPPPTSFYFWMKSKVPVLASDPRLHRWLVVFASDACPLAVMIRPHTKNDFNPSMAFSLDHVMHFHHDEIKADEWLLYELESTNAAEGRAFARGRIWRADGQLLISVTQEALIRTKGKISRL